jgi:hypothetical protein
VIASESLVVVAAPLKLTPDEATALTKAIDNANYKPGSFACASTVRHYVQQIPNKEYQDVDSSWPGNLGDELAEIEGNFKW